MEISLRSVTKKEKRKKHIIYDLDIKHNCFQGMMPHIYQHTVAA